jgi:hypothetical protein
MSGYTNRFTLLSFPELGERVSVLMHNPRLLPPSEMTPRDTPVGPDGEPLDRHAAQEAGYEVIARVVAAWHVYDASADSPVEIDLSADDVDAQLKALEASEQQRLGSITPENVAKLPLVILNRIGEELQKVADPS